MKPPVKIVVKFSFVETNKCILKLTGECKKSRITKMILRKTLYDSQYLIAELIVKLY